MNAAIILVEFLKNLPHDPSFTSSNTYNYKLIKSIHKYILGNSFKFSKACLNSYVEHQSNS